jgi:hypothetical protein
VRTRLVVKRVAAFRQRSNRILGRNDRQLGHEYVSSKIAQLESRTLL